MHGDRHVGRNVGDCGVDHAGIGGGQGRRILAAVGDHLAQRWIAQIGEIDLVELQIAAAGIGKGAHDLAVGLAEVAIKIIHRRIDRFRHGVAAVAEMQRRRRRDRHFRRLFGMRLQEFEMLDHRMRLVAAELAGDAQQQRPRLRSARLKSDFAFADIGFDVIEPFEEIGIPRHAAVFAVADGFRPAASCFSITPSISRSSISLNALGADLAARAFFPRRLERGRAQQAADVIGAEWRLSRCILSPTLRRRSLRSSAASPIARLRRARCLLRWRRSRIAATGRADRARRIWSPRRCGA